MRALRKTVPTTMTQDRRRHTWLQTSLTLTLFRYGTKTEQCTGRVRNRLRLRLPHRRGQGAADPSVLRGLARWEHSSPPPSTAATRVPWKLTPCLIPTAHPRWSTALPSRTIPTSLLLDAVRPQQGVDFCQRWPHDAVRPQQAVVRLLVTPAPPPPPWAEGRFEGPASAVHAVCVLLFWRHRRFDVT
jgi:hypothetical protein